ncbi:hypothetical protein HDU76_007063 [Blyttiomyces sp. JEL0837]|nr:hypothetical protein HDU76_007063 [Blyttiomyces sp. JEL0837]
MGPKKNATKISLKDFHATTSSRPANAPGVGSSSWAQRKPSEEMSASTQSKETKERALEPHPAAVKAALVAAKQDNKHDDTCFICTDPVTWYAVGECNHRVCHLCSLRMRALFKDQHCSMCKTTLPSVIYTADAEKPFSSYDITKLPNKDARLAIYFDSPEAYEDVMILLRFNCPDANCDVACPEGWGELKRHVQKAHGMNLCDLCTRHKKLFTHEHAMYTTPELDQHYRTGDPNDKSFKGHPRCGFCNLSFYGDDELYDHCRQSHEQCFLCTRNGIRHQYYENYNRLEQHFRTDHFSCMEPECLEKKFQVFASDIDLKAHEMEVHPSKRTSKNKGERIDLSFTFSGGPSRRRDEPARKQNYPELSNNQSRGNSSSNDSPAASNDDSPQRARPRRVPPGFGAALSEQPAPQPVEPAQPVISPAEVTKPTPKERIEEMWPSIGAAAGKVSGPTQGPSSATSSYASGATSSYGASNSFGPPLRSQPQAQSQDGGDELMRRLETLFQSDASKLSKFKERALAYRKSNLPINEFIDAFFAMSLEGVDPSSRRRKDIINEASKVWIRMAETIPDEPATAAKPRPAIEKSKKMEEMLRALNDAKIRLQAQEAESQPTQDTSSYATLANRSPLFGTDASNSSSARVLVIKKNAIKQRANSTAWSGASAGKGYVSPAVMQKASGSESPTLSSVALSSGSSSATFPGAAPVPVAPIASVIASSSRGSSGRGRGVVSSAKEFPSLPTRSKAQIESLRKNSDNVWGGSREGGSDGQADSEPKEAAGGKKNKKGKVVLMHIG